MLKKISVSVVSVFLVGGLAYAAPDRTGKTDIGFNASAGIMQDSNVAAYFGGNMSYGINNWSAVGFSVGYENFGSNLGIGDLSAVPLMFDMYVRSQNADQAYVPYAILGLGAVLWDFKESGLTAGSTVNVDTSFGVKLGGGVDWFVNDHWAINFEGSYTFADANVTVKNSAGSVTATGNADFWNLGGGLKYLF